METTDDWLAVELLLRGPLGPSIKCARVSSAQARGRAKRYAYWGVARYEVRMGACGRPVLRCTSGAASDRRSRSLAESDAEETGLPVITGVAGTLRASDAAEIVRWARAELFVRELRATGRQ